MSSSTVEIFMQKSQIKREANTVVAVYPDI